MEVFGPAWENYVARIEEGLSVLTDEDTLILAGDTSWGIDLAEAEADFKFLDRFPGKKYLIKGNHDYWWTTAAKLHRFFEEKGIRSLDILHNNCVFYGEYALCGTRGWFFEEDQKPHNAKVLNREVGRLEASLQAAGERPILCFFGTTRPCTRVTSVRRFWRFWKSTTSIPAAMDISTVPPSSAGWRKNGEKRTFP